MKRMIFALCAVLVMFVGVFAQGLTAYERRVMDLEIQFLNQNLRNYHLFRNRGDLDRGVGITEQRMTVYREILAMSNTRDKAQRISGLVRQIRGINQLDLVTGAQVVGLEKLNADLRAAESLMNEAERAARRNAAETQRQAQQQHQELLRQQAFSERFIHRVLYNEWSLFPMPNSAKQFLPKITPQRGEFETTEAFNERLSNFYRDSTEHYFRKWALLATDTIVKESFNIGEATDENGNVVPVINIDGLRFWLGNYNADKGVFAVNWGWAGRNTRQAANAAPTTATVSVPPAEAQALRQNGHFLSINPADVWVKEYFLYPARITVVNKTDTTKRFDINFPRPQGATELSFSGSALWKDNSSARSLVHNFGDLAREISDKREKEKAEKAKMAMEKVELWIEKFPKNDIRRLTIYRGGFGDLNLAVGKEGWLSTGIEVNFDVKFRIENVQDIWNIYYDNVLVFRIEAPFARDGAGYRYYTIRKMTLMAPLKPEWHGLFDAQGFSEEEVLAQQQQATQQIRQTWANRIRRANGWDLLFRTSDNQIVRFENNRAFPIPLGTYEIQGRSVIFKRNAKFIDCYITDQNGMEHRVYSWELNRNETIRNRWHSTTFNSSAMISPQHGFLGFGIFDTAPENFPQK
ncbi:MAG: hypothetical protein FWE23_05965 [Chitinivibrionia bacterium]|nr:hypothetical protein [Chitinivibrionia bacterium]